MATNRGQDDIYRIVRNKDTCPRSRLKREEIKAAGERVYSVHVVIVMGRVAVHKPRGGRNYFHKFRPALCGPLARAGRCSIGRGWILFTGYQPSITEKRLYSRGAFNPDAGFFIAAGSGGSFVFARRTAVRGPVFAPGKSRFQQF